MPASRSNRLVSLAVLVAAVTLLAGFTALHMHLEKSFPAGKQVLAEAPAAIQLWFSERPERALTRIRLVGPDDVLFRLGEVEEVADSNSVRVAVDDSLPEGKYTVMWQSGSPDGHKVKGKFWFRYDSKAQPAAGHDADHDDDAHDHPSR